MRIAVSPAAALLLMPLVSTAGGIPSDPQRSDPEASRQKAAVSVGYVLVPLVVTDRTGRPVLDLRARDVTLLADGVPVETDLFEKSEDVPVSFTFLLDGSGSMGLAGKVEGARVALRALLSFRRKGDDFALHVFSAGEVREVVPFTTDAAAVLRAVDEMRPFGKTALYDALARMPDRSLLGGNGSRAIVLLTDGIDNASILTREALARLLEGIDVPVYPIGLKSEDVAPRDARPDPEALLDLDVLEQLATSSGGRLAVSTDPVQLTLAVSAIDRDLRSQYLLGFAPTGSGPVRYRQLSVKLEGQIRQARMRAGYFGTEPPRKGGAAAPKKKGKGR